MSERIETVSNGGITTNIIYKENVAVASETLVVSTAELDKTVQEELEKTVDNEAEQVEALIVKTPKKKKVDKDESEPVGE